ncbi:MAG TPA: DinB family protein [Usitatibacter sp.]
MNDADFPSAGLQQAIERLAKMPAFLSAAVEAADPGELVFRPGEDGFSLTEQACHLRDLEREGYLVRVTRMLAESAPALEGFDGTAVAKARDYLSQDARAAAREFAAARRELIALLAPLGDSQLAREAVFGGERITLADLVAMVIDHDRSHRDEIEELLDAMESP